MQGSSERQRGRRRGGVLAFWICVALLIVMLLNQGFHDWDAWGFRPGGNISVSLYLLQLLVATIATVEAFRQLFDHKPPARYALATVLAICYVGVLVILVTRGFWMFTSAHFQFLDSAVAFLSASGCGVLAALTSWVTDR